MRIGGMALALAVLVAAAAAQDLDGFDKGLDKVRGLLQRRKPKRAKTALLEVLEEHRGKAHARARRADVAALMKQCAFRARYPEPDPKTLVSGELESYNPRTGSVKIRYTPDTMGDWEKHGSFHHHPAVFRGPHALTIKGKSYPRAGGPQLLVCCQDDDAVFVVFGYPPDAGGRYMPAQILHSRGQRDVDSASKDKSPCEPGRKFVCQAQVKRGAIVSVYNKRRLLSLRRPPDLWGRVAFGTKARWTEILLEGQAEAAWLQGLADKADAERLKEFEKRYKERDVLPAWLFERAAPAANLAKPDDRIFPGPQDHATVDPWNRAMELLAAGKLEKGLAFVTDADELANFAALRAFLRAMFLQGLARTEEGIAACRTVHELDSDFVPARTLEAEFLLALKRDDEALAIWRGLLGRYPGGADLLAEGAGFLMRAGHLDEARRRVSTAIVQGVSSKALRERNRHLSLAVRGPAGWSRRFDYESKHYHVVSDIDRRTCVEAANLLEEAYTAYIVRLERVHDAERRRFTVYLFSGEEGYQRHCKELFGHEARMSAGLYSPGLKQLLIWNLPTRDAMMETVRHEGFHQYVDRIMDDPPRWFNEGLAVYFEGARIVRGAWKFGEVRTDQLRSIAEGTLPLETWLYLDARTFMSRVQFNYAQAWAFVHFLRHSTRENEQLFERFWEAFKVLPNQRAAINRALAGRSLADLDRDFRRHVAGLR